MPTLEEIREQIQAIEGVAPSLLKSNKKEIAELPSVLWANESLEKIIAGRYDNGFGVLCATNKRLIFLDKGLLGGLKVEDFPYDKISSIQYKTGMLLGEIIIHASGNNSKIDQLEKAGTRSFAEYVRARITKVSENATIPTDNRPSEANTLSSKEGSIDFEQKIQLLERLAKLKEQGILSDEEMLKEKAKILKREG